MLPPRLPPLPPRLQRQHFKTEAEWKVHCMARDRAEKERRELEKDEEAFAILTIATVIVAAVVGCFSIAYAIGGVSMAVRLALGLFVCGGALVLVWHEIRRRL